MPSASHASSLRRASSSVNVPPFPNPTSFSQSSWCMQARERPPRFTLVNVRPLRTIWFSHGPARVPGCTRVTAPAGESLVAASFAAVATACDFAAARFFLKVRTALRTIFFAAAFRLRFKPVECPALVINTSFVALILSRLR